MEGFTYHDIFDTKGIEYIAVIIFLLMLIPVWILVIRRPSVKLAHAVAGIRERLINIPRGIFLSENHSWVYSDKEGLARVGFDNLILQLADEFEVFISKQPGERVRKNEVIAELRHGVNILKIYSPLAGRVASVNTGLDKHRISSSEEAYGNGWLCRVEPAAWKLDQAGWFFAAEATKWMSSELERFREFILAAQQKSQPEPEYIALQDGGELRSHSLDDTNEALWIEFQHQFLDPRILKH